MVLATGNTIMLANLPEEIAHGFRTNNSGQSTPTHPGSAAKPASATAAPGSSEPGKG